MILYNVRNNLEPESPPSRRRGLKYYPIAPFNSSAMVASFSEAWIEILLLSNFPAVVKSRLLLGGVD